jgi:replicative DNA helicase
MAITDQVLDRMPPQSMEAEQAVLGAALRDGEALSKALEILERQNFYRESHRLIFEAMCELFEQGEPIDLLTLQERLRLRDRLEAAGGVSYLSQLIDMTPTAGHVRHHAKIVREKAILRGLIHVATEIVGQSYEDALEVEEMLDRAEKSIFAISEQKITPSFTDTYSVMKESLKDIEAQFEKKEYITGVPTGFTDFDEMTAGLQPGDLVIIAGRPSMGKTAFVLNIAQHAASAKGVGVAIFSLEMSKSQLGIRLLCSEARISSTKLRTGFLSKKDWGPLTLAAGTLSEAPIFIDDTAVMTDLEIRAKARRIMAEKNIGLIIVDYLQLVRGRDRQESRQQEVSEITRSLKALAKELSVPVIAVSQLSRAVEQRQGRRPQLSDLRESGAIEQDADLVAFIYRADAYAREETSDETEEKGYTDSPLPENRAKGIAEIIIGKQRNGPTGTVKLTFLKEFARFENLSRRMEPA